MYLEVQRHIQAQVDDILGRGDDDWHIKNACPCCMFKLDDEPTLPFGFLVTMDGNDSLKRVERVTKIKDACGKTVGTRNIEAYDSRRCKSKIYVHLEAVDVFKDEVKRRRAIRVSSGALPQMQMTN